MLHASSPPNVLHLCRFEYLALQYDSDEIGDLEDEAEDGIGGHADVNTFTDILDDFLQAHVTGNHVHEGGEYETIAGQANGRRDPEAAAALGKVCCTAQTSHVLTFQQPVYCYQPCSRRV